VFLIDALVLIDPVVLIDAGVLLDAAVFSDAAVFRVSLCLTWGGGGLVSHFILFG
jgi:hypothetical protein